MLHSTTRQRLYDAIKACADRILAVFLILLTAPLLAIIAAVLKAQQSKLKVLYIDQREGHHGRRFSMIKFRTVAIDATTGLVVSTRFQTFCRASGIDELPQLFNIAAGRMSFVGPRPFNYADLVHFSENARYLRNQVRPGLVGLWQLGRQDKKDWSSAQKLDLAYVRNRSFLIDLAILILAPITIVGDIILSRRAGAHRSVTPQRLAGDQVSRDASPLFNAIIVQLSPRSVAQPDRRQRPFAESVAN